jgi:transcriptional regulator with XRE-family HTH domain
MTITGAQVRAARKMLGWTTFQLESKTGVRSLLIAKIEAEKERPSVLQITVLQKVLESAGVEFTNGDQPGVRLRKPK